MKVRPEHEDSTVFIRTSPLHTIRIVYWVVKDGGSVWYNNIDNQLKPSGYSLAGLHSLVALGDMLEVLPPHEVMS